MPSEKEVQAVMKLDGPKRFAYFVKRVVDSESVYGLWNDGWSLMANSDEQHVLPLWPSPEYAAACIGENDAGLGVEEIQLDRLMDDLIPKLMAERVLIGVFPLPTGKGVVVRASELLDALREEEQKY